MKRTPNHSQRPLCFSCHWATIVQGFAEGEFMVQCGQISHGNKGLPFPIYECSQYRHKLEASLHEMRQMAYVIEIKDKQIGFVPPKRPAYYEGEDD